MRNSEVIARFSFAHEYFLRVAEKKPTEELVSSSKSIFGLDLAKLSKSEIATYLENACSLSETGIKPSGIDVAMILGSIEIFLT